MRLRRNQIPVVSIALFMMLNVALAGVVLGYAHVSYVLTPEEIRAARKEPIGLPPFQGDMLALLMLGLLLMIVVLQFVGLRLTKTKLGTTIESTFSSFDEHVPLVLRLFVGAFLILSGLSGTLFAPQLGLELGPLTTPISALELVSGVFLVSGFMVKVGALLLVVLVGLAFTVVGIHGLDQLVLLGAAMVVFLEGGLRSSIDSFTVARIQPLKNIGLMLSRYKSYGMPILRLTLGITLLWLALTEKLLAPELTEAAVVKYNVPFFPELQLFVIFFGFFEAILGAHYLLGIFNRVISGVYLLLLISAIFLFGETVNHLHLFGVGLAFLIRGAGPYRMNILLAGRAQALRPNGKLSHYFRPGIEQ